MGILSSRTAAPQNRAARRAGVSGAVSTLGQLLRTPLIASLSVLALLISAPTAQAALALPAGFSEQTLVSGLDFPVDVAWRPDGVMYVAERYGTVRVVDADGTVAAQPLIDISSKVNGEGDHGLLGVAVDGQWSAGRHFVYVSYVYDGDPANPDAPKSSRISRFPINANGTAGPETVILGGGDGSGACPAPAQTSDCIPADSLSHSIGTVLTMPDGTLYAGSGDAADFNTADPLALRTYDEASLAGKIVHVDRNGKGLAGHPFCPIDPNLDHVCTKLYAKGFRNPFRFSVNTGPDGGLAVGDVGWNEREEFDLAQPGRNYGWPCYEGVAHTPGHSESLACQAEYLKEGTPAADTGPNYQYLHNEQGASIIGGPIYNGANYPPSYAGKAFFGDYSQGFMSTLDPAAGVSGYPFPATPFATGFDGVSLRAAPNGDIVVADILEGKLARLVYSAGNRAPIPQIAVTPTGGDAPLSVHFSAAGTTDPDGDALTYSWDWGDGKPAGTGIEADHTYTTGGTRTATLTVTDARGKSATATSRVFVGDAPPQITINSPANGSTYRDGQTLTLDATVTDPEDGVLSGNSLAWDVRLLHLTHQHPAGIQHGSHVTLQTRTDHDSNAHYEVTLTATDSDGQSVAETVSIYPQTVPFILASEPAGAPVSYSGMDYVAPAGITSAIGYVTTVSATPSFMGGDGHLYAFDHWSDGGDLLHDITIPGVASTLTASYRIDDPAPPPEPPGGDTGPPASGTGDTGATGPQSAGAVGGVTLSDKGGPRVSIHHGGRIISGSALDPDGLRSIRVALRRVRASNRAPCQWWLSLPGRFSLTRSRCSEPRWMFAVVARGDEGSATWRLRLARAPVAPYAVRVMARDRLGTDRTTWLTVAKKPSR
jgi:glucose/arabinose dehydrogenase